MATKTEIYELRKKEENDFYNVEDFNNNMDTLEKALTEFDDTGTAEGVTSHGSGSRSWQKRQAGSKRAAPEAG